MNQTRPGAPLLTTAPPRSKELSSHWPRNPHLAPGPPPLLSAPLPKADHPAPGPLLRTSWLQRAGCYMSGRGRGPWAGGREAAEQVSCGQPSREAGNLPTPLLGRAAACFPHPGSRRIAEACVTNFGGRPHHQKNEERRGKEKEKCKTGNWPASPGLLLTPSWLVTEYFPNILSRLCPCAPSPPGAREQRPEKDGSGDSPPSQWGHRRNVTKTSAPPAEIK